MFKKLFAVMLACVASFGMWGAEFEIKLTSCPSKVVQGSPVSVTVEVSNISGHPVTVARGYGGFGYMVKVRRADGKERRGCKQPYTASYIPGFTSEVLPIGWHETRTEDITCDDTPGEWIIQAEISCHGPYLAYSAGQQTGQIEAWSGEVKSDDAHISLVAPTGTDLETYRALKACPMCDPARLLKDFPSSTYAGYALLSLPTNSTPITRGLGALRDPDEALRNWADQGGGEEQVRQTAQQAKAIMENYAKSAALFLSAHPDFVKAPLIRRAYAICLGLTGCMPEALDQVRILAQGQGKEADEAKTYLAAKGVK